MNFEVFNLHPAVTAGVRAAGFAVPTPIQSRAIPPIMARNDIMGLAQTGTGKTAAFALPILDHLVRQPRSCAGALIVAPTRELAEQIAQAIGTLGRKTGLKTATIYGGVGFKPQFQKLKRGVDIIVACPGRLLDHLGRGTVDLSGVEILVLDEADQMFDMGFLPDIRRILKHLPKKRQNLLFSATMPHQIRKLAKDMLRDPTIVQVGNTAPAETVSHALYPVAAHLKTPLLMKLLDQTQADSVLVFTRTKHRAKRLGEKLVRKGFRSASIQGNLSQRRRQAALDGFRNGTYEVLVATDIAARGIDVRKVSHVINYDIPSTPEAYIHRIGRTGRAANTGEAFTLMTSEDNNMVKAIDRIIGTPVERRTIEGFDYKALLPAGTPRKTRPPRRPAAGRKRGRSQKSWAGNRKQRGPNFQLKPGSVFG
ncbi:ATP-dependent RNA helicase RhlE (EC [Olavius algarvensis associated proteobacterium Delta 3]|nr:ATP-dependent RNA helicase RhlE (EC [Olavius algarvensis associated proteobacterium Delta 3]